MWCEPYREPDVASNSDILPIASEKLKCPVNNCVSEPSWEQMPHPHLKLLRPAALADIRATTSREIPNQNHLAKLLQESCPSETT